MGNLTQNILPTVNPSYVYCIQHNLHIRITMIIYHAQMKKHKEQLELELQDTKKKFVS